MEAVRLHEVEQCVCESSDRDADDHLVTDEAEFFQRQRNVCVVGIEIQMSNNATPDQHQILVDQAQGPDRQADREETDEGLFKNDEAEKDLR